MVEPAIKAERHRILLVVTDLANGGAQTMNFRLAEALGSRGHLVDVAVLFDRVPDNVFRSRYPKVRVNCLGGHGLLKRMTLPFRLALIARPYDVIVAGMDFAATNQGFVAAAVSRKPFISWMHIAFNERASSASWFSRKISLLVYRFVHHIIFPSNGALQSLAMAMEGIQKRTSWHVIENFDSSEPGSSEDTRLLQRHVFSKPVILSIGRLATQKAYQRLIRAHASLIGQGIDHHLAILGEGDQRALLEAEAKSLGVSGSVFLPGHVSNARSWICLSTVFALCSEYEGLPLVLIEALREGAPIVAMDCPSGPAEILEGGKAGMLTPAGDQAAFEAALVLLMTSPETREKYVAAGKAQANRFAASRVLPMWEQVLDDVLMSHRKRRR